MGRKTYFYEQQWTAQAIAQMSLFDPINIPLTKGYIAIVDPIDSDLAQHKWYTSLVKRPDGTIRYVRAYWDETIRGHYGKKDGRKIRHAMSRLIMERMVQRTLLITEEVDHIDGNPLNNCRSNLRLSTRQENSYNSKIRTDNTSGFKGVTFCKQTGRWMAQIVANKKKIWLGRFDTPEEAHAAYCEAARKLHGEFARLE